MNVQSVSCVYFSPTGTTKAIVESITLGISAQRVEAIDITKQSLREGRPLKFGNEIVILIIKSLNAEPASSQEADKL